jgi:hypothetical protein
VLDTIAPTLGRLRRRLWRKHRDAALDQWSRAGLWFNVVEDDPEKYPKIDDMEAVNSAEYLCGLMVFGKLRLMKSPGQLGGTVEAFADWRCGGGLAAFKMGKAFWLAPSYRKRYVVTHEIGHALGLNHNMFFGGGVMSQPYSADRPDTHDIDSLREYYA